MILLMAMLDMLGIASIMPFIAVLSNPQLIETNIILSQMFEYAVKFGVQNNQEFLLALGILVFIFSNITYISSFNSLRTSTFSCNARIWFR